MKFNKGIVEENQKKRHSIYSKYDQKKINSLFRNFDTMSFLDLVLNYRDLQLRGYNKTFLNQNLNSMLSLPFFLVHDDCFSLYTNNEYVKKIK